MAKRCIMFLTAISVLFGIFSFSAGAASAAESGMLRIEAENCTSNSGDFKKVYYDKASGGALMRTAYGSQASQLDYAISAAATDYYDIWILANPKARNVSPLDWKTDSEAAVTNTAAAAVSAYKGESSAHADIKWTKLGKKKITEGNHTISMIVDKGRDLEDHAYYFSLDCIVIVPTTWRWYPTEGSIKTPEKPLYDGMWLEGEDYIQSAGFKIYNHEAASGSAGMTVEKATGIAERYLTYSVNAEKDGEYDIYVLGAPVANYISPLNIKWDSETAKKATGKSLKNVYTAPGGIPVVWYQLGTKSMVKGTGYKLTLSVETERSAAGGGYVQIIDSIVVLPHGKSLSVSSAAAGNTCLASDAASIDKSQIVIDETKPENVLPQIGFSGNSKITYTTEGEAVTAEKNVLYFKPDSANERHGSVTADINYEGYGTISANENYEKSFTLQPYSAKKAIWIEAENYGEKIGEYKPVKTNADLNSAGSFMQLNYVPSADSEIKEHSLKYNFEVSDTDKYEVWVLSTLPTKNYVSSYKVGIDGNTMKQAAEKAGTVSQQITTVKLQGSNVPVAWIRVDCTEIEKGTHTLKILTDAKRISDNKAYLNAVDAIAIVPSTMKWNPDSLSKPEYNGYYMIDSCRYDAKYGAMSEFQFGVPTYGYDKRYSAGLMNLNAAANVNGYSEIFYDFNIDKADEYDIWVMSFNPNVNYLCKYYYSVDNGEKIMNTSGADSYFYTTGYAPFGPSSKLGWCKMATENLECGKHSLGLYVMSPRNGGTWAQSIGTIMIVPKSWNYTPDSTTAETEPLGRPSAPSNGILVKNLDIIGADTERISASANISSYTGNEKDISVFAAIYENNVLKDLKKASGTLKAAGEIELVTEEIEKSADKKYEVKAFVWGNENEPLANFAAK